MLLPASAPTGDTLNAADNRADTVATGKVDERVVTAAEGVFGDVVTEDVILMADDGATGACESADNGAGAGGGNASLTPLL